MSRIFLPYALILLTALSLMAATPTADWPTLGGSAAHSGRTAGSVLDLQPQIGWSVPMADAPGNLVVAGGRLYVTRPNEIACFSATTGALVWTRSLQTPNPPTVDGDLVLVASVPGSIGGNLLYALDATTGATRWTTPFTAQWNSYLAPIVANGRVYSAGGYYGGLYGFDRATGAQRFFLSTLPQTDTWTPAWADGRLLSWLNGVVRQHDPETGAIQRSLTVLSDYSTYSMGSTVAAVGGRLYVTSPAGLHAIDAATFTTLWTAGGYGTGTPAADATAVYVLAGTSLRAVRASNGQVIATRDLQEFLIAPPVLTDDAVVVASSTSIFILERGTLALRRSLPVGGQFAFANGALFVADAERKTLWRFDQNSAPAASATFGVTRGGAAVAEGATVSGTVRVTVTVRNAIGLHAQIYGNFALLPANEAGEDVDTDPWVRTVDVDTRRFFDGENLLSMHLHPHSHHGGGLTTDFTFATFRIISENANPAANGDRLLPTVRPGALSIATDATHGPLLSGSATIDDDRSGTGLEVERFFNAAQPVQVIAHLGTSVLGRQRWQGLTPPVGDGALITSSLLRPFLRAQPQLARIVYFAQDGAGRANYSTTTFLLPAATPADVAAMPAEILHAHDLNVHNGDTIVVPDGGSFRLWVKVVSPKPLADRYRSMSTWIGNRSVASTSLEPYVAALAPGETSFVVPVDLPGSEVAVLQAARQGGEMATAFALWHDFHQGENTLETVNLPNMDHLHLTSIRTASYPWPYGTPTVAIEYPYEGAAFGGGDFELRYAAWGPLTGVSRAVVQLDGGAPIADTDFDGRLNFTAVPRGTHRVTVTLVDAQGQPLASTRASASSAFTILNRAPVALGDAWRLARGTTLTVPAGGMLANDGDADGDPLQAVLVSAPTHGVITLSSGGGFTYTPQVGFSGVDTFAYQASDGQSLSRPMLVQLIVLAPGASDVSASWTTWGNGPTHTSRVRGALGEGTPTLAWSQSGTPQTQQAVIADGRVYVSQGNSFSPLKVRALDAETGSQVWQRDFASGYSLTAPTLVQGVLYVQRGNHSSDTQLMAINQADGSVRWSAPFGAQFESYLAPCVANGAVYINGGSYGGIYGFEVANGAQRFFTNLAQLDRWTPAYADGRLFSWVSGTFREHDQLNGATLRTCLVPWTQIASSMNTAAAIDNGMAVLRSNRGLYAVDLTSFKITWSVPGTGYVGTPTIADGLVYACGGLGIEVRSLIDGTLVMSNDTLAGVSQVIVADDVAIVPGSTQTWILRRDGLGVQAQLPFGGIASLGQNRLVIAGASTLACYRISSSGAPAFASQPASATVTAPTAATYTVTANSPTALTYQWQSAPSGSTTFTPIIGATAASYTTGATSTSMSGAQYRCVASNSVGSSISDVATLTVDPAPTFLNDAVVAVSGPPTVVVGSTATVSVAYETTTARSINVDLKMATPPFTVYSSTTVAVSAGSGTVNVQVPVPGTTPIGPTLAYLAYMFPNGGGWNDRLSWKWQVDVIATTAPTITSHPADASVIAGAIASFTVATSGVPAPTIQWQRLISATWTNIGGATNSTYVLSTVFGDNGAQFRAVATNNAGTATSNAAALTVTTPAVAPAITSQPVNATVTAGATAIFTVATSGTPTPTIQWQRNISGTWTTISGATSATYSLTSVLGDNAAQFRAQATNSAGTATSNVATLTVNPSTIAPAITSQPGNVSVAAGAVANFTVAASGTPAPTIQWQRNISGTWTALSGATSATFSLTTVIGDNGAQFRVLATNGVGTATSNVATLTVTSGGATGTGTGLTGTYFNDMTLTTSVLTRTDPQIGFDWGSGSPASGTVAADRFSARWTGTVQAQLTETYTFFTMSDDGVRLWVNGQPLITNWTDHGPTENSGTIALTAGVQYGITMEYFENGGGAVAQLRWSSPSTVKALVPQSQLYPASAVPVAPAITSQPVNATVTAGATASFTVAVSGAPAPTIQWQRNISGTWTAISGFTSATFNLTPVLGDNAAQFRAQATNSAGTATSNVVTLTVSPAPTAPAITSQPVNRAVTAGAIASFTVAVSGTPAPTIQWQRNVSGTWTAISGATSATYTMATVIGDDGAQFRALASNSAGTATSNPATLQVLAGAVDTTDGNLGTVSARGQNGSGEGMLKAFDNTSGSKWLDFAPDATTRASWIQYSYAPGTLYRVTSYTITSANDAAVRDPRDWSLLGSNDGGVTWMPVDTRLGEVFSARLQKRTYSVAASDFYRAYRLQINSVLTPASANSVQLAEIELLSAEPPLVTSVQ